MVQAQDVPVDKSPMQDKPASRGCLSQRKSQTETSPDLYLHHRHCQRTRPVRMTGSLVHADPWNPPSVPPSQRRDVNHRRGILDVQARRPRISVMSLHPADPYPAFDLVDQSGERTSSATVAGSWFLLYWYPKADTPGCTAQALGLRDQIEVFEELGCPVIGASFDSPASNRAFAEKYQLPFRLLSDHDRALATQVGAAEAADASHARRVAHLVRPDGTVAAVYDVDDPEFFAERVLDDLELLGSDGTEQPS